MKTLIKKALIHFVAFANDDANIMVKSFNYRTETTTNPESIHIAIDQEIIAAEKSYARNTFSTKGMYVAASMALALLAFLLLCGSVNSFGYKILSPSNASALGICLILALLYISLFLITLPNYKLPEISKYICYLNKKSENLLLRKTTKTEKKETFNPLIKFNGSLTELAIISKLFTKMKWGGIAKLLKNHIADENGQKYNYESFKSTKSQLSGCDKNRNTAIESIIGTLQNMKN